MQPLIRINCTDADIQIKSEQKRIRIHNTANGSVNPDPT